MMTHTMSLAARSNCGLNLTGIDASFSQFVWLLRSPNDSSYSPFRKRSSNSRSTSSFITLFAPDLFSHQSFSLACPSWNEASFSSSVELQNPPNLGFKHESYIQKVLKQMQKFTFFKEVSHFPFNEPKTPSI